MKFDGKHIGGIEDGPVIEHLYGDEEKARTHIHHARVQLGEMKHQMQLAGIKQNRIHYEEDDGSIVEISSCLGEDRMVDTDIIHIESPFDVVEEEVEAEPIVTVGIYFGGPVLSDKETGLPDSIRNDGYIDDCEIYWRMVTSTGEIIAYPGWWAGDSSWLPEGPWRYSLSTSRTVVRENSNITFASLVTTTGIWASNEAYAREIYNSEHPDIASIRVTGRCSINTLAPVVYSVPVSMSAQYTALMSDPWHTVFGSYPLGTPARKVTSLSIPQAPALDVEHYLVARSRQYGWHYTGQPRFNFYYPIEYSDLYFLGRTDAGTDFNHKVRVAFDFSEATTDTPAVIYSRGITGVNLATGLIKLYVVGSQAEAKDIYDGVSTPSASDLVQTIIAAQTG